MGACWCNDGNDDGIDPYRWEEIASALDEAWVWKER